MSFIPRRYDAGKVERLPLASGTTVTKYQLLKYSSGYLADGASGDNEVEYIALETVTDATASDGGTYCDVIPIDDVMEVDALASTTPVQATHVGNTYDISDANTVDLGNTTDKVFTIISIVNATDKIVRGRFNRHGMA